MQNNKIQTHIASYITRQVSANLKADFSIESVDMIFFNRVILKGILLRDQHMDTLLYAPRITANLRRISSSPRRMQLSKLKLVESTLRLAADSAGTVNLQFILDTLKNRRDTTEIPWAITVSSIQFSDSRFLYQDDRFDREVPFGLDFADIELVDLNFDMNRFHKKGDTVSFVLNSIRFTDRSGFSLENMRGRAAISKQFIHLTDAQLKGPGTEISAASLRFDFDSFREFRKGVFGKRVDMDFLINSSEINFRDLSYFVPRMQGWKEYLSVSGQLRGKIGNLKGRDLMVAYNTYASFSGDFDMIGLPEIRETFMFFDIRSLAVKIRDLETLEVPGYPGGAITIPETLAQLGSISYSGNFTGFLDDFVTYGRFDTGLGRVVSDISIKPAASGNIGFNGNLETEGFDLGKLISLDELVGRMSMSGMVNGYLTADGDIYGSMDGNISSLGFNQYDYQNISLSGELSKNAFDGSFGVEDSNLKMQFFGRVDFSDTVPEFDFTTEIERARLYPLKISGTDPDQTLSCLVRANFRGSNLSEYDGRITLLNSLYEKSGKQVRINDLVLEARHSGDTNRLLLRSKLVDAEITGSYNFIDIPGSAIAIIAHHFPEFSTTISLPAIPEKLDENHFFYQAQFKNALPLTDFFFPQIELGKNSAIQGEYAPADHVFLFTGSFPYLRFGNNSWDNLEIDLQSNDAFMFITARSDAFSRGNTISLKGMLFDAAGSRDSIGFKLDWLDRSARLNSGHISGFSEFLSENGRRESGLLVSLDPGNITINDTIWQLHPGSVRIDSTYMEISGIKLQHNRQYIMIDGIISEDPADQLLMKCEQFDLKHLNQLSFQRNLSLDGMLEGTGELSDLYNDPLFISDLVIRNLSVNEEPLGETSLTANWINAEKKIDIYLEAARGDLKTIDLRGGYYPGSGRMNFSLRLDKLRLNIIKPYMEGKISEIRGIASGYLEMTGTTDKPLVNGEIDLQKSSFRIDYLQTAYSLSDRIKIMDNRLIMEDIQVFDEWGNLALFSGTIDNTYLRNYIFDLQLDARDFYFLNTREKDNNIYYGKAVATGLLTLTGPTRNLQLTISATSERNTQLFIPLNRQGDISENTFITFLDAGDDQATGQSPEESYDVRLMGLNMTFNLTMTPDAEVQIIFDPRVGDILRGNGNGSITLEINDRGDLGMFGEYIFESGNYLFTLQNIINKNLKLQEGGGITWNGNPTDAVIDLQAIYSTKSSPYILVPGGPDYLKRRLPVDCHLIMQGNLMSPGISFKIELPTAEEETRNFVRNAINTQEELTKQFLSLLVMNNFSTPQSGIASAVAGNSAGIGMAGVTTSELLSNQLSNWLSQISSDFDIGVNYRPGDELSSDQMEVALSTQILDDRVSIHTNLDVSGQNEQKTVTGTRTTSIAGEFDVDVKLTDDGKLRVKAFNHSNDDQLYKTSPYTQGVGFAYGEDFNSFSELLRRYFGKWKNNGER